MTPPKNATKLALGNRVRARRERLGLTLVAFAARADLHQTYVGQVERGERDISVTTLLNLAKALNVDGAALIGGLNAVGEPPASPCRGAEEQRSKEAGKGPST